MPRQTDYERLTEESLGPVWDRLRRARERSEQMNRKEFWEREMMPIYRKLTKEVADPQRRAEAQRTVAEHWATCEQCQVWWILTGELHLIRDGTGTVRHVQESTEAVEQEGLEVAAGRLARPTQLVTPEEAARQLAVAPKTIRDWLRSGTLAGVKVGGKLWRIPQSEIERMSKPKDQA